MLLNIRLPLISQRWTVTVSNRMNPNVNLDSVLKLKGSSPGTSTEDLSLHVSSSRWQQTATWTVLFISFTSDRKILINSVNYIHRFKFVIAFIHIVRRQWWLMGFLPSCGPGAADRWAAWALWIYKWTLFLCRAPWLVTSAFTSSPETCSCSDTKLQQLQRSWAAVDGVSEAPQIPRNRQKQQNNTCRASALMWSDGKQEP